MPAVDLKIADLELALTQFEISGTNSICPNARSTGVARPNT